MNKFNLKVGQILGDYRVVSVGEEGAFIGDGVDVYWHINDEIQSKFNLPKEKWVPKYGDRYFCIASDFSVIDYEYEYASASDAQRKDLGNCFRTREEAEAKAEQIKKLLKE